MKSVREPPAPSLAHRAMELRALKLPNTKLSFHGGRALTYRFQVAPSDYGRIYTCELFVTPDARCPDVHVLSPDLPTIAGTKNLPHTYSTSRPGTKLCLWWPKRREWQPQMRLSETYIPWTVDWLWYFEDWLVTRDWSGGGEHPDPKRKRWSQPRFR